MSRMQRTAATMGTKIDDPTTWVNLGEIDPILKEVGPFCL